MHRRSYYVFGALIVILALGAGSLGAYRLILGQSLGVRSAIVRIPRMVISTAKAAADHGNILSHNKGEYTNIIFLHHSVGTNLIAEGNLREELTKTGFTFYDHGYNDTGLVGPDGVALGYSYSVPGDNTDPEGLAAIFSQKVHSLPINTLSGLLQHEVIIIKSCYTGSQIPSDEQLEKDKTSYLEIRKGMAAHPEKLFIILTSPPLNPAETNPDEAERAYELTSWLADPGFTSGYNNIHVFDMYGLLAEYSPNTADEHTLKAEFRIGADSHPNQEANEVVGKILVDYIKTTVHEWVR